jgi:hypothetical protein
MPQIKKGTKIVKKYFTFNKRREKAVNGRFIQAISA